MTMRPTTDAEILALLLSLFSPPKGSNATPRNGKELIAETFETIPPNRWALTNKGEITVHFNLTQETFAVAQIENFDQRAMPFGSLLANSGIMFKFIESLADTNEKAKQIVDHIYKCAGTKLP
jgi:hypothetical protein